MSLNLQKVSIGYSPLTQKVYIFRFGKDPNVALDKREARTDVITAIVNMMTDGSPNGSVLDIEGNGQKFELELRLITDRGGQPVAAKPSEPADEVVERVIEALRPYMRAHMVETHRQEAARAALTAFVRK